MMETREQDQAEAERWLALHIEMLETNDEEKIGDGTGTYAFDVGRAERYMIGGGGPTGWLVFVFDSDGDIDGAYLDYSTMGGTVHAVVPPWHASMLHSACATDNDERNRHGKR